MRHARTHKLQLSGPTVHSYTVTKPVANSRTFAETSFYITYLESLRGLPLLLRLYFVGTFLKYVRCTISGQVFKFVEQLLYTRP